MSRTVLVLLAAVSLGFAPAPFLEPKAGSAAADLKALQGEWTLATYTHGGKPVLRDAGVRLKPIQGVVGPPASPAEESLVIVGTSMDERIDGFCFAKRSFKIDARKILRAIDFSAGNGTCRGVYRIDGDTLTISFSHIIGDARPADLAGLQPNIYLKVYKRKKP